MNKDGLIMSLTVGSAIAGLGLSVWIGDYETQKQIEIKRAEIEQTIKNIPISEVSQEYYFRLERLIAEEDSLKTGLRIFYK